MYLLRLADRVATGLSHLNTDRIERHRNFLRTQQMPDGGFRGREGESDLYYTGFALRALAVTGGPEAAEAEKTGRWLAGFDVTDLNVIDTLSWLYSAVVVQASGADDPTAELPPDFADRIIEKLELLRCEDGGYAKAEGGASGSTYHSFLAALTYELLGRSVPRPNRLTQFLYDRQRDDGGFVEIAPMRRSGTNPTAAAVALLQSRNAVDSDLAADIAGFLTDVVSTEGGFQANTRIPFADGLSTFTGLLTAQDISCPDIIPAWRIRTWVENCIELPDGGFRGAAWDQQADTEYTFYGLGILGLLGAVSAASSAGSGETS